MNVHSLSISVCDSDTLVLSASRVDEVAALSITTEGTDCEILMDRATVHALRDQLPATLAGLDRWISDTEECVKALEVQQQAADAVRRAEDLVAAVEQAGDAALATRLRQATAETTATASAVDAAVSTFVEAAIDADSATARLICALSQADDLVRRPGNRGGAC
jgi:hypothetical protein